MSSVNPSLCTSCSLTPLTRAIRVGLCSTFMASTVVPWVSALAQTPTATESAPAQAEANLQTITIKASSTGNATTEGTGSYTTEATSTATGLTLSLRETPQSVTVITRERMDDQSMNTVEDVLRNTAGVSLKSVDRGRNGLAVRGFSVSNFQFDGIPTTTGNVGIETNNTAIYDHVEVVRGATGLLSGAGDPSATVNLVRKHADSKTFTGSFEGELGSWNRRAGTLDLSTPLNTDGSVRARMVLNAYEQDAFIDLESTRGHILYGVIDADLGHSTRLSVGASQQVDKRNGVYWGGLTYWFTDGTRTQWDRSKTTATRWNHWDTEESTAFANVTHSVSSGWQLRGDAQFRKQIEDSKLLWVWGTPERQSGLGMNAYPYHYHAEPTQTHLGFSANGPFSLWGREHELIVGVMHGRQTAGWDNRNAASEVASVGNFNQWDGSFPEPALTPFYRGSLDKTRQTGIYGATRLQLTDALTVIAGARVSNWRQDGFVGAWTSAEYTNEHKRVVTPYLGLVQDLSEHVSAYASVAEIFKPQSARDRLGNYLDPLEGRNSEVGLKGELFDGQLNASIALFRIDQDNFATPDVGYLVPGTTTVASRPAKGVKAQGYELEIAGQVAAGWQLGAAWTQYSARDAQGEHVVSNHPRKQLKLFTKHKLSGFAQGWSLGGGIQWESTAPITATNPVTGAAEPVGQPAYALVDLMASYAFNARTQLQINIDNALDKHYYNSSWSGYTYGEPRKLTVAVKHRF